MDYLEFTKIERITNEETWSQIENELSADWFERNEISEFGFSFGASLKDIYKAYLQTLSSSILKIDKLDLLNSKYVSPETLSNFLKAATGEVSNLDSITKNILSAEVRGYFIKQIITQLGEKSGQRHFQYSLDNKMLVKMIGMAKTCYEVKNNEREKVELSNVLNLFLNSLENKEEVKKYLSEYIYLEDFQYNDMELQEGESVIEFSPPAYEHQTDIMIRIYKYSNNGYTIDQYSLPFHELNEIEKSIEILNKNNVEIFQTCSTTNPRNSHLSKLVKIKNNQNIENLLNSLPQFQEAGGIQKIDNDDKPVIDKLNKISQIIDPFVNEITSEIPKIILDKNKFDHTVNKYKEIMLVATITANGKQETGNAALTNSIESGELLKQAVGGKDLGTYISKTTDGAVGGIHIDQSGDCDRISGTIGNSNSSDIKVGELREITSLTHKGDIELKLFETKNKKDEIMKVFYCPVCKTQGKEILVDICEKECNSCNTSLETMRLRAEKGKLGEYINNLNPLKSQSRQGNINHENVKYTHSNIKNNHHSNNTSTGFDNFINSIIKTIFGFIV